MDFVAWFGRNGADHKAEVDKYAALGYRFVSLSIYDTVKNPLYAGVMVKRPMVVAQREFQALTPSQLQQTFNEQAGNGFGPTIIAATGTAEDPLFAAVFEPAAVIPLTRFGLSGPDFQAANTAAFPASILTWAAVYGDPGDERYAGIWHRNTGNVAWNADGIAESLSVAQQRFNAQVSGFARQRFITASRGQKYLSVYSDDQIGPWLAEGNLTGQALQAAYDKQTAAGFFPLLLQGAGEGANARFSVLFAKQEQVVARVWGTPTGSPGQTVIDGAMQSLMTTFNVRGASLAITKGSRLVYTQAYTYAEPGYPATKPLTYFRIASCSKMLTALAIHVLIERKTIGLTQTIQTILNLKTPTGAAPVDSSFNSITVQSLLEQNSGLPTEFSGNEPAAIQAYRAANPGKNFHLPASADQIASYMASVGGSVAPGTTQAYSNLGYFMLGQIVAKETGGDFFSGLKKLVLDPLHINATNNAAAGMRQSLSLAAAQATNEARYHSTDLVLRASVMSDDQPLVSREYGDEGLEAGGPAGGISASAAALARVCAVFSSKASPAPIPELPYGKLEDVLTAASKSFRGHGFDQVDQVSVGGSTAFRTQKGGLLQTSQNGISFIVGDVGFVVLWNRTGVGGDATKGLDWYPYFPKVVTAAQTHDWGTTDLFPSFGMPSF